MGREVRKVPADWQHPKDPITGYFKPLLGGSYEAEAAKFLAMANEKGLQEAVEWMGCPDKADYMPDWSAEQRTHLMMYENTSEGTPISPAFATPEELARWLVDNNASAFGGWTASYEGWLSVARGGFACSAVIANGAMTSGVDGLSDNAKVSGGGVFPPSA